MALSSRLAVSGQISVIIWPDIRYYPAGYPVLSGRISGKAISRISESGSEKIAGYPVTGYPVLFQSAGYPVSGYPAKSLSGASLIARFVKQSEEPKDWRSPIAGSQHASRKLYRRSYLIFSIIQIFLYYQGYSVMTKLPTKIDIGFEFSTSQSVNFGRHLTLPRFSLHLKFPTRYLLIPYFTNIFSSEILTYQNFPLKNLIKIFFRNAS